MPAAPEFTIANLVIDEQSRRSAFPVVADQIFLGHAAVTTLPRSVADAITAYTEDWAHGRRTFDRDLVQMESTRALCAKLIGAKPSEIALLGPTSLGLSLFAAGLPWEPGDEIVCYQDDYPANVYPWLDLERLGVKVRYLRPAQPGAITPALVADALTPKTKLVALASCHFFSGYRIDVDTIGKLVHENGSLFSLDAIQTLGAFETKVDHVDFLSADSHKWLLGLATAGIVYVAEEHFDRLRPALLGAWNVRSPGFIPQDEIVFEKTARRYEPGVLNITGIVGMHAALEMLLGLGIGNVSARIMEIKAHLVSLLERQGFSTVGPSTGPNASGITTVTRPAEESPSLAAIFRHLSENKVTASLREDRSHTPHLRFSPHFYNTAEEIARVAGLIESCP